MFCQNCGVEAPTKYVAFYQNIGALVMRFSRSMEGHLCKSCIHRTFWSYTGITLLVGWLGMISIVLAPFFVLNNVVRYLLCLSMPAVPLGAMPPTLTEADVTRLEPHMQQFFERLDGGEDLEQVAQDTALRANASPGQVMLLFRAILESQKEE
ncbi:MAG: hypothetical protein H6822_31795 [Planctomycetaceae bacterium]|nr:hypothetical protein [Planctomycetales bacterium]MCB9926766.1 hypothetical protein [Planctomycetaceae bacterium]